MSVDSIETSRIRDEASEVFFSARQWAAALGVPVAYLYADNSDLAEVILAFGLLPEHEQRLLAADLKARVSPPTAKARPARRAPVTRRAR